MKNYHSGLAICPIHIEAIGAHVDVDAIVHPNDWGSDLNNLCSGASVQFASQSSVCVKEDLVLVASNHAGALQVDGETSVVATEDVLQTVLREDNLPAESASRGSSRSLGTPTGGGGRLKLGLGVFDIGEGERPDVAGHHVARVSSSIVGGVAGITVDSVLCIDDRVLVVHMRHHVGVPESLGRRQGRGSQRQQQQPGWKKVEIFPS